MPNRADKQQGFRAWETCFASPLRVDWEELCQKARIIEDNEETIHIYNSLPDPILILNQHRQTVFANKTARSLLQMHKRSDYLGKRPGELLKCCHSEDHPAGCGCSESCSVCGAVKAILQARDGNESCEDCHISTLSQEAFDLRIWARPISIDSVPFILLIAHDVSSEKRRAALERIFFHDITNTANILRSYQQMIVDGLPEETEERFKKISVLLTDRLMDEVQSHRILLCAERKELSVSIRQIQLRDIFDQVDALYSPLSDQRGTPVKIQSDHPDAYINTDPILALRILGNMIKNAVEASDPGQEVELTSETIEDHVLFHVHNAAYISKPTSLQIFTRSFSTKGKGRGLGTYCMKLLAEKYLKGHVYFTSDKQQGTTFTFDIPINYPDSP